MFLSLCTSVNPMEASPLTVPRHSQEASPRVININPNPCFSEIVETFSPEALNAHAHPPSLPNGRRPTDKIERSNITVLMGERARDGLGRIQYCTRACRWPHVRVLKAPDGSLFVLCHTYFAKQKEALDLWPGWTGELERTR